MFSASRLTEAQSCGVFFILLHNLLRTKMQGHSVAQWTEKFNLQDFVKYIGKYTHTHVAVLHNPSIMHHPGSV